MITDRTSITNMNPMKGRRRISSIIKAITAIVAPRAKAPVSPMKNFAGGMLFHRNPAIAPAMVAHRAVSIQSPFSIAMSPRLRKDMIESPPASPSNPSVMFTALANPVTKKMNNGM